MSDSFVIYIQIYYNRFQVLKYSLLFGKAIRNGITKITEFNRKAVDDYQMIQEGDKIAVGFPVEKTLSLFCMQWQILRRFYPKKFFPDRNYGRPGL